MLNTILKPLKKYRYEHVAIDVQIPNSNIIGQKSHYYYSQMLQVKAIQPKTTFKLQQDLNMDIEWSNIYMNKIKCIPDAKLREFKYKILLNIPSCQGGATHA